MPATSFSLSSHSLDQSQNNNSGPSGPQSELRSAGSDWTEGADFLSTRKSEISEKIATSLIDLLRLCESEASQDADNGDEQSTSVQGKKTTGNSEKGKLEVQTGEAAQLQLYQYIGYLGFQWEVLGLESRVERKTISLEEASKCQSEIDGRWRKFAEQY